MKNLHVLQAQNRRTALPLGKCHADWMRVAALSLALCSSSCSSANKYVKDTFRSDPRPSAVAKENEKKSAEADVKHAYTASKKEQQKVEPLSGKASAAAAEAPTDAKAKTAVTSKVEKLIAQGEDPFAGAPIQQASNEQVTPSVADNAAPADVIQHEGLPREPFNPQAECRPTTAPLATCPPTSPCSARPFPGMEPNRDEFVCDGGDKGTPVHYEGRDRAGLDLEDTVAEYKDETGKTKVVPSTEACIYAPRFGSVSSASLPEIGNSINKAAGHQDLASAGGMDTRTVIDEKTQTDEAQGIAMRSRAGGVNNRLVETEMQQTQSAGNHVKVLNAHEQFKFLQEGQFDVSTQAILAEGVGAAQEWSDGRRPIIVAKDSSGQIVQGRFTAQDFTGVEDKRTPGELKLIKVADKRSAHPGDIVTFTIRFENVGGRDLNQIRIVDNLSPRLEFIEDSIQSDRNGKVDADDNGFGGKLLTFEFDEILKGKSGGFVSFQCRVR